MKDYVPRAHQEPMHAHLKRLRKAALYAGCGAGKTVVTGTHMAEALFDRMAVKRWLIVAPKMVAEDTWHREFGKWKHLAYLKPRLLTFEDLEMKAQIADDGRRTGLEFSHRPTVKKRLIGYAEPIHVCSYEAFVWLVRATGVNFPYDGIVFDESVLLKSMESQRYKAAKHVINKLGVVSDVIELCGTPIPKGYEDLQTQFILLDKGERLGITKTEFRDRWMRPDVTGRSGQVFSWAVKKDRLAEMQKLIGELAISADRDIGVELVESDFEVELPPAARKAYDEMAAKYLIELDGEDILSANAAVMRAKLLQICNGHVMDNDRKLHRIHDAKLDAVVEAATSSPTPVLVAYPYQADERALAVRLGRSMRLAKEPGAIEQFRQGKLHVLGFHPETMSHGVDGLQGVSNTILWFGAPDRFDWYHQVFKRLHRDGQQASAVFVRRFIAKNTIERRILDEVLPAKGGRNAALLQTIRKEHT